MKTLFFFFTVAVAFVACIFSGGCVAVEYEELPPMPEYPRLEKSYNLSAAIEVLPCNYAAEEELLRAELRNNHYVNFSDNNYYYKSVSVEQIRLLSVLHAIQNPRQRPEGSYLDTRIIVSVRDPGVIWNGQLKHRPARYFQAYSRIQISDDMPMTEAYSEGLKLAVENLFLIGEFRNALEPVPASSASVPGIVETPAAMWQKSLFYQRGQDANIYEALRWAYLAAQAGHLEALNYFVSHAINSNICGNYRLQFALIERCAKNGHVQASIKLGEMYEKGQGIAADPVKALGWYRKGADKGDGWGYYHLARCYENGIGTDVDLPQAVHYYNIAARNGISAAAERIEALTE